jgi:hypothetical protein
VERWKLSRRWLKPADDLLVLLLLLNRAEYARPRLGGALPTDNGLAGLGTSDGKPLRLRLWRSNEGEEGRGDELE